GAGSSSLAIALMPYRLWFRAAGLLALAIAWVLIYRRRQNHPLNRLSFALAVALVIGQWVFWG
ncbi:MAG: hypothetical protein D6715_11075, partial [Calditrichaeota bacterium]